MNLATQALGAVAVVTLVAVAIQVHEKPTNHVVDNSHIGEIMVQPKMTHTHNRG
jgi:hypothetical protein